MAVGTVLVMMMVTRMATMTAGSCDHRVIMTPFLDACIAAMLAMRLAPHRHGRSFNVSNSLEWALASCATLALVYRPLPATNLGSALDIMHWRWQNTSLLKL